MVCLPPVNCCSISSIHRSFFLEVLKSTLVHHCLTTQIRGWSTGLTFERWILNNQIWAKKHEKWDNREVSLELGCQSLFHHHFKWYVLPKMLKYIKSSRTEMRKNGSGFDAATFLGQKIPWFGVLNQRPLGSC